MTELTQMVLIIASVIGSIMGLVTLGALMKLRRKHKQIVAETDREFQNLIESFLTEDKKD